MDMSRRDYILIVSLAVVFTFLSAFVFRFIDNNRVVNWQWVFSAIDVTRVFLPVVVGLIISYGLSLVPFPGQYAGGMLFILSFALGTIFWREPEVILDSSRYFTQAKHLGMYGVGFFLREWGNGIPAWTDLPLIPFLYGLVFKLVGEARVYVQILNTTLFSGTVVITYLLGKTLWNRELGIFAGLSLLGMPYLFTQVPLMLVDVGAMFFLSLAILSFIRALESGGRVMVLVWSPMTIFLALLSKYSTWLMLSVLLIIAIVYLREGKIEVIKHTVIIAMITSFFIGVVSLFKFGVFCNQLHLLGTYQSPGLRRWQEGFLSTFFFQIHPFVTLLAGYSLYLACRRRDLRYGIISYLVILIFLGQIERARYIIPILPMLALMAGYGASRIRDMRLKGFIAGCIVTFSLNIAAFAYLPFLQGTGMANLRDAGAYLDVIEGERVEVFSLPDRSSMVNCAILVPMLDIFTKKQICFHSDNSYVPTRSRINTSSLRFTWEHNDPVYYTAEPEKDAPVVVISNQTGERLPVNIQQKLAGYRQVKTFNVCEGIFRTRPFVRVYQFYP